MLTDAAPRDPISEGWFVPGTPLDHERRLEAQCPVCGRQTTQDEYVAILGKFGGVGAPFFIQPFVKKRSTVGKIGRRSRWLSCTECGSLIPADEEARSVAAARGGDLFAHVQSAETRSPVADSANPSTNGTLPAPPELEDILQRGAIAAREILERKFPPPWTLDVLDAGLREELWPAFLASTEGVAVEVLGAERAQDLVVAAHVVVGAGRVVQLIRADAAMTSTLPRAQSQAFDAQGVANHLVGAVMTELGLPNEEAAALAAVVMRD